MALNGLFLKLLVFKLFLLLLLQQGFPGCSDSKESACSADLGLILGLEDLLEKGMATHSSIRAWRIPWMESSVEPTVHE